MLIRSILSNISCFIFFVGSNDFHCDDKDRRRRIPAPNVVRSHLLRRIGIKLRNKDQSPIIHTIRCLSQHVFVHRMCIISCHISYILHQLKLNNYLLKSSLGSSFVKNSKIVQLKIWDRFCCLSKNLGWTTNRQWLRPLQQLLLYHPNRNRLLLRISRFYHQFRMKLLHHDLKHRSKDW